MWSSVVPKSRFSLGNGVEQEYDYDYEYDYEYLDDIWKETLRVILLLLIIAKKEFNTIVL